MKKYIGFLLVLVYLFVGCRAHLPATPVPTDPMLQLHDRIVNERLLENSGVNIFTYWGWFLYSSYTRGYITKQDHDNFLNMIDRLKIDDNHWLRCPDSKTTDTVAWLPVKEDWRGMALGLWSLKQAGYDDAQPYLDNLAKQGSDLALDRDIWWAWDGIYFNRLAGSTKDYVIEDLAFETASLVSCLSAKPSNIMINMPILIIGVLTNASASSIRAYNKCKDNNTFDSNFMDSYLAPGTDLNLLAQYLVGIV